MNLNDCIGELIQIEENASELYKKEALISDERFRAVMEKFAKEELLHRGVLIRLPEKMEEPAAVMKEENVKCLNRQKDHLEKGIGSDSSQKEFFKFALQMEKNSVELYESLAADFAPETSLAKTFAGFAQGEKRHMIFILNALHDMV